MIKRIFAPALICLLAALLLCACGSTAQAPQAPQKTPYETAQEYVNKPYSDLVKAIGEPKDAAYVPSCFGTEGAEDGELHYEGFTVTTLRDNTKGTETVTYVSADTADTGAASDAG